MSDANDGHNCDEATTVVPEPIGRDSWSETCSPSMRNAIESSSVPLPHISLRADVDDNATTVKMEHRAKGQGPKAGAGRYEILGEIARGGMGAVFRGRDADLNRDLAIKVLLEKYAQNVEVLGRFIEEAQIGGQLQHPGIVPVYELGQFPDKRPFFAMKLVKGRTLSELLKERASPTDNLPRFLKIFEQICETMAYAHSKGVIHRDLKPLNVMVGAFGEVQVMDWGLAKVLDRKDDPEPLATQPQVSAIRTERSETGSTPTEFGELMGTAAYMPPEQARGETGRLDERTDVFALGSILCEILTGSPAYRGRMLLEIIDRAKVADLADACARLNACGCEPDLIAIASACLAPVAEDRPRDASRVTKLATAYLAGVQERLRASEIARAESDARAEAEEARAEAENRRAESERARRRTTLALAAAMLLAVTIGCGSWMAFRLDRDARLNESDRFVGDALATAKAMRGEAERAGVEDADAWGRALDAADKAKGLVVARPPRAALAQDVAAIYDTVAKSATEAREQVRQIEAERRLVVALDEARMEGDRIKDGHFDHARSSDAYLKAFREAKLDVMAHPTERVVAQLMEFREQERIAAALLDWAASEPDKSHWNHLVSLAERIDPDPFRNKLRAAVRGGDTATLLALGKGRDVNLLPAPTIYLLANTLAIGGHQDEAIAVLLSVRGRYPGDFWIHELLGILLKKSGPLRIEEAIRYLSVAVALKPDSSGAHGNLGEALRNQGKYAEAVDEFRRTIELDPDQFMGYLSLGLSLHDQGKHAEAVEVYRRMIRIKPDSAGAYVNLGIDLGAQGETVEGINSLRQALRLNPDLFEAHLNLGLALRRQGKLAEAVDEYRVAIRLKPDRAVTYNNLGFALDALRKYAEAEEVYRTAIRIDPRYASAYCSLGLTLQHQGRYAEALASLRQGHEMGSKQRGWKNPSAAWLSHCEQLAKLEARLPALLQGEVNPANNAERLMLGQLAYDTQRFAISARFWADALVDDPKLGDDGTAGHRYNAACSAAMAGTGQGIDDTKPDDAARIKLRGQAKDWLRAEISAWEKVATTPEPGNKPFVAKTLQHWKSDADLAGVRDADALAKLPETERAEWRTLWDEVDALLAKVAGP